jgi:transcriptional regulator with XRE-family HTH domain
MTNTTQFIQPTSATVALRIRALRKARGWTLHDVESRSSGSIKAVVMGSYERGSRALSLARSIEIANLFGIPLANLLGDFSRTNALSPETLTIDQRRLAELMKFDPDEKEIWLKFDRIFNINDTDYDNPSQMINIILSNNSKEQETVAGRGIIKNLNYMEQIIGVYKTRQYLSELGRLLARLNYQLFIKLDDIEIVFGKLNIKSGYNLFVIDFDRCSRIDVTKAEIKKRVFDGTYADLGLLLDLRNYTEYDKLSEVNKLNFEFGYIGEATKHGISAENAKKVFNNLRK